VRFALGGGGFSAKGGPQSTNGTSLPDFTISGGGMGMDFAIGGTPSPGLVLGGEFFFQQATKPNVDYNGTSVQAQNNANFGLLGPFIDWYPDPSGGFHLGAMIGISVLTVSDQNGNTVSDGNGNQASERGGGGAFSIGYDFFVSPQFSLGVLGKLFGGTVSSDAGNGINEKYSVSGGSLMFSMLSQ
jgi:hypothetical protein